MESHSPRFWEIFFEVFEDLPRQGPGSKTCAAEALALCRELPESPSILDLGCGVGGQTLYLAALRDCGFEPVGHFPLPDEAWWDDFYTPMEARIAELRIKYADDQEASALLENRRRARDAPPPLRLLRLRIFRRPPPRVGPREENRGGSRVNERMETLEEKRAPVVE